MPITDADIDRLLDHLNNPSEVEREALCIYEVKRLPHRISPDDAGGETDDTTYRFVGTTATRDRQGDEIPLAGWDFKAFRKNPVVLWSHDYTIPPIGKVVKITTEQIKDTEAIVFEIRFAQTAFAQEIRSLVDDGIVRASSVGFRSLKSNWIEEAEESRAERLQKEPDATPGRAFLKKELLELSLVPVPANAEALRIKSIAGGELHAWLSNHFSDSVQPDGKPAASSDNDIQQTGTDSDNAPDRLVKRITDKLSVVLLPPGSEGDFVTASEIRGEVPDEERLLLRINEFLVSFEVRSLDVADGYFFEPFAFEANAPKTFAAEVQAVEPSDFAQLLADKRAQLIATIKQNAACADNCLADGAFDASQPNAENADTTIDAAVRTEAADDVAQPADEIADKASTAGGPEHISTSTGRLFRFHRTPIQHKEGTACPTARKTTTPKSSKRMFRLRTSRR